jgi:hypothetical protein
MRKATYKPTSTEDKYGKLYIINYVMYGEEQEELFFEKKHELNLEEWETAVNKRLAAKCDKEIAEAIRYGKPGILREIRNMEEVAKTTARMIKEWTECKAQFI